MISKDPDSRHPDVDSTAAVVSLRPVESTDADLILEWQRLPSTRQYFSNPATPSAEEHAAWFSKRFADRRGLFTIIMCDGAAAGMLRLDALVAAGTDIYSVTILVAPESKRMGIATAAMMQARDAIPGAQLRAEVQDENLASQALFRRAGFEQREDFYVYPPLSLGE